MSGLTRYVQPMSITRIKLPAYQNLLRIYENRREAADACRAEGGKVLGILGTDVPEELAYAAGLLPITIAPLPEGEQPDSDAAADRYLEYCFDQTIRSRFGMIVSGDVQSYCNYIAVSNSTDALVRTYLYLRELKRREPNAPIPPLEFYDLLFTRARVHQMWNEEETLRLMASFADWGGRQLTAETVTDAAIVYNENRAALRRISALRLAEEPKISGTEALVISGAGMYCDPAEHTRLIEALLAEAGELPAVSGPRIFMTGSDHFDTKLYEYVEEAGAVVVAEDHNTGMRRFERDWDTRLSPEKAAVDRYMLRSYSSKKALVSQRTEALLSAAKSARADAVIFFANEYEESASWDWPSQKKALEEAGIRAAEMVKLKYPAEVNKGLKERIAAFIEALRREKGC